jgi:copper(I)-binding protein
LPDQSRPSDSAEKETSLNAAPGSARRLGIGVAVAVAALALAGCAAGQHAPTSNEVPVVDGVSADAGPIALRAVTVAAPTQGSYPADGDATLQLVIVNDGHDPDRLVGVRTPQANEVRLFANAADADAAGAAAPTSSASAEPSSSAATPSPTESTSAPAPSTLESLDLPAGRAVSIGYSPDLAVIQLHGLTSALFPAESFPITFQFAGAGTVTFTVAVHLAPGPSTTPTENIKLTADA